MKSLFIAVFFAVFTILSIVHAQANLADLGAPPNAKGVVIFGQGAHLDWDWLEVFDTLVNNTPPEYTNFMNPNPLMTHQYSDQIFNLATKMLANRSDYGYQVCEMSFLKRFSTDRPALWNQMKSYNAGKQLAIVGGGITSPDNLLPHGEAFLRTYLSGISWLKTQNVTWSGYIWMPDDFGHDSQLPVMAEALGAKGVSFARLPDECAQGGNYLPAGTVSAHRLLLNRTVGGLDFVWSANDGSSVFSFYMPNHYCTADRVNFFGEVYTTPEALSQCQTNSFALTPMEHIASYISMQSPSVSTANVFVVSGCDFATPVANLMTLIDQWNAEKFNSTGMYAVSGSFDKYANLVKSLHKSKSSSVKPLKTRNFHGSSLETIFRPTPYWTGFYASRAALKKLHYESVRYLLASEIYSVAAVNLGVNVGVTQADIDAVWTDLAPSTHHDFITGTATDHVYQTEQLPLLQRVSATALNIRNNILKKISTAGNSTTGFFVFNPNGFNVSGPLILDSSLSSPSSFQKTYDGKSIGIASVPCFGYISSVTSKADSMENRATSTLLANGDVNLQNSLLSMTISPTSNWGITSLIDRATGQNVLSSGNLLSWRNDGGNIYRFGYESRCPFDLLKTSVTSGSAVILEQGPIRTLVRTTLTVSGTVGVKFQPENEKSAKSQECSICELIVGTAEKFVTENTTEAELLAYLENECSLLPGIFGAQCKYAIEQGGALILQGIIAKDPPNVLCYKLDLCSTNPNPPINRNFTNAQYIIEYSVLQGEPFVRINLTGVAAGTSAVIVSFDFGSAIEQYYHGTPYHWDYKSPMAFGSQPDFQVTLEATHGYIVPTSASGLSLGAIYHKATPAWGVLGSKVVGVPFRNAPGGYASCPGYGADGTDTMVHSVEYAVRIPSGLASPASGMLQKEVASYQNPLIAYASPTRNKATVPPSFSLASIVSPSSALLTSAKLSTYNAKNIVFRVSNPSNAPAKIILGLTTGLITSNTSVALSTALEVPLSQVSSFSSQQVVFPANRALSTLMIQNGQDHL